MAIIEQDDEQQQLPNAIEQASPQSCIPTEIFVEVLLKLPVESLLRCKSVCKLWCSLISEPHFVKSHLNISAHNNNNRLIFRIGNGSVLSTCCFNDAMNGNFIINGLEVVDYPFKSTCKFIRVVGSCNGLVCLRIHMTNDPYYYDILVLWNPSTRKYHKLPSLPTDVYIPIRPVHIGFGYDDYTDDYKVVSVYQKLNHRHEVGALVKIYSLRNGVWKDIGAFPHGIPRNSGEFVNGALHWLAYDGVGVGHSKIVSLDLATETFGEVMQPVYGDGEKGLLLGTLGEWLCALCNYNEGRVDLWAMKVYSVKVSWTKLFSVPYIPDPDPMREQFLEPLCISNDGKILLTFGTKLMIYDSKNGSFLDVKSFDGSIYVSTFAESLVSPMPPAAALGHGL